MDNYDNLIMAINALTKKDTFDILIAVGPFALSFIALGISIYTVWKQNRIALFDKRYHIFEIIRHIILFSKLSDVVEESYIGAEEHNDEPSALDLKSYLMCEAYNSMFGANLDYKYENSEKFNAFASLHAVTKDLMMEKYLFSPQIEDLLNDITNEMFNYVLNTLGRRDSSQSQKQFREKCSEFESKWLPELERKIKMI